MRLRTTMMIILTIIIIIIAYFFVWLTTDYGPPLHEKDETCSFAGNGRFGMNRRSTLLCSKA
jgi:hypothetical protein